MLVFFCFCTERPFPVFSPSLFFTFISQVSFHLYFYIFERHSPKIVLNLEIFYYSLKTMEIDLHYLVIFFPFSLFSLHITILYLNFIVLFSTSIYLTLIICFCCAHLFHSSYLFAILMLITNIIFHSLLKLWRLCF